MNEEHGLINQPKNQQVALLNDLMSQEHTEDKLAAIIYLQIFWLGKHEVEMLELITNWFEQQYISDWNVCDWLCVRLLSPTLDHFPEQTLAVLKGWLHSPYLWQARAALVPFAQCKTLEQYINEVNSFSTVLIRREERFCKTAVGWVLREYSKINPDFVRQFLNEQDVYMTKEVIKNATRYFKQ